MLVDTITLKIQECIQSGISPNAVLLNNANHIALIKEISARFNGITSTRDAKNFMGLKIIKTEDLELSVGYINMKGQK